VLFRFSSLIGPGLVVAQSQGEPGGGKKDDDVVDAEFEDVKK
jgi:hypothetical protein